MDPACLASAPAEIVKIDCATVELEALFEPMEGNVRLVADEDCTVHGFALWFDTDFYGKASLSTAPAAKTTHWYQTVLMLNKPHTLKAGQALEGTFELEPGSNPGQKRNLRVMVSYDVVESGEDTADVYPDDRKYFREFMVQ